SENEEGTIREDREVSNDLDEQQQYQAAASASHARQSAVATAVGSSSGGGASYLQGYFPPEPGTGAPPLLEKLTAPRGLIGGYTSRGSYERALVEKEPLFLGDIEVARCVLLVPHKLTLKEFTTLRKKPEDKGGLHPVWGFHWVKPNENMTWNEVEDLFWRYVQRKGYSDHGYEPEATQPYAGAPSQVVALQQEEIRLLRDRVYALEIALGVDLGGEAASRAGQPGAVERLRADVASLFRETRDLHGRVDRRADLSSYDSLRSQLAGLRAELHGHAPQQQPHSYQVQFDQGSYGAPAYAAPMYAAPSYDQRAYQAPYRDPTPRFEELRSSPLGHPPLPAAQPEPEGHGTS
ncbi:hypothetical protein PF002_g29138, partial [Phytophthora fragariae]